LVAGLIALGLLPVQAQEDVAETKASTHIDTTPIKEAPITASDRSHWSFAPVQQQPLPETKRAQWLRTAIDAFILARLESKDIQPAPEASRPTLLRRLSFDLTGLPPTPEELAPFEADQSPDAYERRVDRLLASPAFGERYGQYWLDLARFAETDGYEHDKVRPNAWRYRDWVIAALNADMPYDEFVRQQIAGDEGSGVRTQGSEQRESEATSEQLPANQKSKVQLKIPLVATEEPAPPLVASVPTMFCLAGPDMPDINDQVERRHSLMNEMTATVGAVFLGLQLGCAQCHNHKYDPLSQADFYRLRAVFEPAVATLKRDVPFNVFAIQKDTAPARFWIRGDHKRPGLEVHPAFPRIADSFVKAERGTRNAERGTEEVASHSALRAPRSAFAAWLVSDDNPLTSRVMANRIWQGHFGRGLCATPSDFGTMGAQPMHPELLDWQATELRAGGWEMKRLHRMIVSSATYRQISDSNLQSDLYSGFPRQRLSGEAIRDAMLAVAGLSSVERGGPGVMPPLPEELVGTLLKGQWTTSKREADHYKRSVYVFSRRNLRYPIFEAFDRPDGNATCPIRNRSTTAPQSLLLFNSEFSLLTARHLAGRILSSEKSKNQSTEEPENQAAEQIGRLYELALSRRPTANEVKTLEQFLASQQRRLAAESRLPSELALPAPCPESANPFAAAALVDACLAILNSSEFIYLD
jgi:hypothetical protein